MIKPYFIFFLVSLFSLSVSGQVQNSFIKNEGQWEDSFDYKLEMPYGALFLEGDAIVVSMADEAAMAALHHSMHGHDVESPGAIDAHAYEVKLLGAQFSQPADFNKIDTKYNYFLGNNPENWKSDVGAFREVRYGEVYEGIDVRYYFSAEGNFKYDFVLAPKADPSQIELEYIGVDGLELDENGNLHISTSVDKVVEMAPFAFQEIDGQRQLVECDFTLVENKVTFKIGDYNRKHELIIDPELVFSTFSGSTANNFGYTATYSVDGGLYAGGVVFNDGGNYPTTRGAFQVNLAGPRVDIAISKFSSDGNSLEYATYLGGGEDEMPYSLVETLDKKLVIFGSTGSSDFPTRPNAFDRTFAGGPVAVNFFRGEVKYPNGSDVFVVMLDSLGGSLPAATLYGGSGNDGFSCFDFNYGDQFRGEVIADSSGNIYVAGGTYSENLTVGAQAYVTASADSVNGFIAAFDPDLSNLRWASYIGGSGEDMALSVKLAPDQQSVYVAGATESDDMGFPVEAYRSARLSAEEGYIVQLSAADGSFLSGTYNGTLQRDINYFIDVDYTGDVYVVGQTNGDYPVEPDPGVYYIPGSAQYIHQFNNDLTQSKRAMVFGDGAHLKCNISPTAFMVDDCRNVYVSGWGGAINQGANHNQGWTNNLPLTPDAYQSTTDGSDFYYMILDASWKGLAYATYFGGSNDDHVDGGTSRFSPDGTIYQAVCGGCFGNSNWPTTDSAYSRQNKGGFGSCNLAAMKMTFNAQEVEARVATDEDSVCVPHPVKVFNESFNGDVFQWILPGGTVVNGDLDSIYIKDSGKYSYQLIAKDTMCDVIDTTEFVIYGFSDSIVADFKLDYDSCSNDFTVVFSNVSKEGEKYRWDFGDGEGSDEENPVHTYLKQGEYEVTLISQNTFCGTSDTAKASIDFVQRISTDEFIVKYEPCRDGNTVKLAAYGTYFQEYNWDMGDGVQLEGRTVEHQFENTGKYSVSLTLKDTICDRYYQRDTVIEVFTGDYTPWLPNIFTPNGDGLNDYFGIPQSAHPEFFKDVDLKIYNRWGALLYHATTADKPWDGTFEDRMLAEGVYFYILNVEDACANQKEIKGFVHLMNQ